MSLISDIKANFGVEESPSNYIIWSYPDNSSLENTISIYGVLDQDFQQQNTIAVKPLEQSQFTTDSVQIKPYVFSIRCMFMPLSTTEFTNLSDYSEWVINVFNTLRNYANGVQLFTINNLVSFAVLEPVKLLGIRKIESVDISIPEYLLTFSQIQSSNATAYSTTKISPSVSQPQNKPPISNTGAKNA